MKKAVIAMYALLAIVALAVPANAQDDTTPPKLQALSISSNVIDTSSGPQVVTVTATVTDDLSGVQSVGLGFVAPSGSADVLANLILATGDTYVGDATFPQFSPQGIWTIGWVSFRDNAGNNGFDTNAELQQRGINVVIGNGSLLTAYPREISDMNRPTKKSVSGKVSADVRACEEGTPVRLQRKRSTGWKTIEETWLEFHRFDFNHLSLKTGARYRVYVPAFGLGTPVLTTCGKAAQKFKLES
jgi:hypothetical protein